MSMKMQQVMKTKQMDSRESLHVYPRVDQIFKKKHSYNFDMMKCEIFQNREKSPKIRVFTWIGYFITGLLTGLTAFIMSVFEEWLVESQGELMQHFIESNSLSSVKAWAFGLVWCIFFAGLASVLTVYVGPGANGSGIAELMAVLNGVNYPDFMGVRTLIVKIVGVIFGIVGFLYIGKEGPLAHIGAVISQLVIYYIPFPAFEYFKNDLVKREFAAAGASAGVSAAFASPIGGSLFSYELSKPTTFWTFSMIWRVFFCSAVSTFTLSLCS
jgi:chloride channel 7